MSLPKNVNLAGGLIGLAAYIVYSCHDALVKYLGQTLPAPQILFFVILFNLPFVMGMLVFDRTAANLRPRNVGWVAIRTALMVFVGLSVFYAYKTLPLAEAYTILFSVPLLITAMSVFILREEVGPHRWGAVVVGLGGVLYAMQPGASSLSLGHFCAIGGAFGAALGQIALRKIGSTERMGVIMIYPMLATLVALLPILPFVYVPMGFTEMALSLATAAVGFGGGLLMITGYRMAEAAVIAPMQYVQMLMAALFGAIIFSEPIRTHVAIGAAIVTLSGLYVLWRESRTSFRSPPTVVIPPTKQP